MNRRYTQKQIEESICRWSSYMLENGMMTEDECKSIIGEGLFRRMVGATKRGIGKVKDAAKAVVNAPKQLIAKIFKPNDGVKKMLMAMNKASKDGVDFKSLNIYASLGDAKDKVFPIVGFALMHHKSVLVLLIDSVNKMSKPKSLGDLRQFLFDNKINIKDVIDSIKCGTVPQVLAESILLERTSKLVSYLSSKKLTKKAALKPKVLKELMALTKQSEDKVKASIEKYFADSKSKSTSASSGKKTASPKSKKKTSSKRSRNAKKSPSASGDADVGSSDVGEPSKEDTAAKEPSADSTSSGSEDKDSSTAKKAEKFKTFDNQIEDVVVKGKNIGFIFSKSKAEIALDKKYAEAFAW